MKKKIMIYISQNISRYCAGMCVAISLLLPTFVGAQSATTFSVSPSIFDMTANPGQTWKSSIRVINANPYELHVFVDVVSFVPKGESGTPKFIPLNEITEANSTLAQWITTEKEIVIAPEKTIELPLMISLPPTAAPGGHFAAVMISTKPSADSADNASVQTSQVISSLIFLRVSGDVSENSTIRSFRTTNYLLSRPEATFELRIENKGNVHVQPQGEIKIFNMWGQERGVIPVNQQTLFGNVLPNSVRKYAFTWNSEWSVTDIGRYTAVATLAYGLDGRQSMTADTAFWIIPWKILLLIFVVVGGFITLVTWAIRLYVSHMLKLAGITPGATSVPISAVEQISIATKKTSQRISVVAPLEAGMLDLRSRLKHTTTFETMLKVVFTFVKTYWKFFSVLLAVLLFILAVVIFMKGAFTPTRDFEVTIEGEGQNVTVTNDDMAVQPAPEATSTLPVIPISIVNRSGQEVLTHDVRRTLETAEYQIANIENDFGTIEETTVIVYDPALAETALKLSALLGNVLLSSYVAPSGEQPEIVIYIGTDMEVEE